MRATISLQEWWGEVQKFRLFCALVIIFYRGEMRSVSIFHAGHHWPASETTIKWRFAGGPMVALGDGVVFQVVGSGTLVSHPTPLNPPKITLNHCFEKLSCKSSLNFILTLNAPIATKVVCFSRLLKCLRSLYCKQCGSRSDCSYRSSLFWDHAVCFYT